MPSLAARMSSKFNRRLADRIGETLAYGSVVVQGFFYKEHRELQFADGNVDAFDLSFDCSYSDVNTLAEDDEVEIFADDGNTNVSLGVYAFKRFTPDGGDESNWVTLVLREV